MSGLDLYDRHKPEAKYVCDGCWATSNEEKLPVGWLLITFKHLKDTWLCPTCQPTRAQHCINLQARGL